VKVARHLVEARRERLADLLRQHRYLPLHDVCSQFGISEATARRDLAALSDAKKVTRTYGGALADYNATFASFAERRNLSREAKRKIAARALALLRPGMTCYLDAGTTMLALAEALRQRPVTPLTIVTNNLLVAETLAEQPGIEVHLLGGLLLRRQSVLLGEQAKKSAAAWRFDLVFLGAEGMDAEGITNSQDDVVEFQKTVAGRSKRVVLCLDAAKLGHRAAAFLFPWKQVDLLLTDASAAILRRHGIAAKLV